MIDPTRCPCCGGETQTDRIYFLRRSLIVNGQEFHLFPSDLSVLRQLLLAKGDRTAEGRLVTFKQIGGTTSSRGNIVKRLRHFFSDARIGLTIQSVWGKGYFLEDRKDG